MDINKPVHQWQLSFEGEWPTSVAFVGDGRTIAAGNRSGQIFVWRLPDSPVPAKEGNDAADKKDQPPDLAPTHRLDGHTNGVTHLRTSPDDGLLLSSSLDHSIRIWDIEAEAAGEAEVVLDKTQREQRARRKPKQERDAILNAPGAKVATIAPIDVLEGHAGWVNALDISDDGKRLISGDDTCLSIVWDLASRKQVSSWRGYDRVWVRSAALSPDGQTAFTCEYAGRRSSFDAPAAQARLWNSQDGSLKTNLLKIWTPKVKDEDRQDTYAYWRTWSKLLKRGLVCADFSPDGKLLAVGQGGETDTGKVHLVDVETGEIQRTVSGHKYGVCDVRFSSDSKLVLSCGRDTTVRICQVSDGKEVAALGKPRGGQFKDWLHGLAISKDQTTVAAADIAGFIHIWRLKA